MSVPYCPGGEDSEGTEPINTIDLKFVADYAGISIPAAEELDVLEFFLLLHDAAVWKLSQSKDGREYLETAARLRMTEPEEGGGSLGQ